MSNQRFPAEKAAEPAAERVQWRRMVTPFHRTLVIVAVLNLAYFGVEVVAALVIGSVSLLADSIDFLEDAALNMLILIAIGWSARHRSAVAKLLALIIVIPGLATLWMTWQKIAVPIPPAPLPLSITGGGALLVNFTCALLLVRVRHQGGSLGLAAFLSARNDVLANAAIILAGLATSTTQSIWPDVVVGLAIAAMNAGAAGEVYRASGQETDARA
jgi:Co/Zn/Cd efflux system component